MSDKKARDYDYSSSSDILSRKPTRSLSMKSQKAPEVRLRSILAKAVTHFDRANDDDTRAKYIKEMWEVVEAAWQLPVIGRDLAYEISDTLRREKLVAFLVTNLQNDAANKNLQRECARLLSQVLTTDNRHYVSKNALEILTKFTRKRVDLDLVRTNISILESMFKESESTSTRLFDLGALDTVIYACRYDDLWTARFCAAALANAAIFGGSINHKKMVDKGAPDWLFPLAFRTDDFCRFYACLAITVLAANPLVERAVMRSGTLDLVEPFVQSHDPYEFAQANPSHAQGRSASFLQRMIPLLISGRPEAQALASFYFAMEASIKAKQQKTQDLTRYLIFSEVSSIIPLKRVVVTSRSSIARTLAARCLKIIGEDVPRKLSPQIEVWDMEDVQSWLTIAGFRAFHSSFRASTVDGEMLLLLTESELKEDLDMTNNVHRKRFMRDLDRLRAAADYRSVDTTGICEWLRQIDPRFSQYTYRIIQAGIDKPFLPKLTDAHLQNDCGIENGVHRTRILSAAQNLSSSTSLGELVDPSHVHDVFISYRRKNGSHLASLLKVHLQLRGFRVFLDVESLQEGEFADKTLKSVKSASAGFILILTAGALDKCAIDHEGTDWLHKEIVTAISHRRNIVPVTTEMFQWPLPEDLPQDISQICFYNGVKWVHEYQDACVDKIVRFLKGQDPPGKLSRVASVQSGHSRLGGSQRIRSSHPRTAVRPSRSSDNLLETDRVPRPRQRASPPGQASHSGTPALPTNRGVTGAQAESTRSLDQGDGAPYDQNVKPSQYPPKARSSPTKAPDLATTVAPKKTLTSPSSASSSSSASSKNVPAIKKDVISLKEVLAKERKRSQLSGDDISSDYSSSEEGEGWEPHDGERGGADGKSKPEAKSSQAKPSPANVRTVVAEVEKAPVSGSRKLDHTPTTKKPQDLEPASKSPPKQTSPDHKPKPSSKYKAPPPPSYEVAKHMPETYHSSSSERTPETDRRPTPTPRPTSGGASKEPLTAVKNESARPTNNQTQAVKAPSNRAPDVKSMPQSAKPSSVAPKPVSRPATSNGSVPTTAPGKNVVKPSSEKSLPVSNAQRKDSPNMIAKPPRSAVELARFVPLAKSEDSSVSDDSQSLSDESESDSNLSSHGDKDDNLRTNADGNDGASSSSRSASSSSSDLSEETVPPPADIPKPTSSNVNNSNNTAVNNVRGNRPDDTKPKRLPRAASSNGPRPGQLSKSSSTRSTPLNRSSHSIASADAHSPPRSPTRTALVGVGKPIARRDTVPMSAYPTKKLSASERLQLTRPPPPNYPIGSSFGSPPHAHNHPGYNMEQYKAAMAASIRAPYPGHPVYPHAGGHSNQRHPPPAHGFDTAV